MLHKFGLQYNQCESKSDQYRVCFCLFVFYFFSFLQLIIVYGIRSTDIIHAYMHRSSIHNTHACEVLLIAIEIWNNNNRKCLGSACDTQRNVFSPCGKLKVFHGQIEKERHAPSMAWLVQTAVVDPFKSNRILNKKYY